MKISSILNIDPVALRQVQVQYPDIPDDDAYLAVLNYKQLVESAKYNFVFERLKSACYYLTLLEVGSIVIFFKMSNSRPVFYWCKPDDIKEVDYADYISSQLEGQSVEYTAASLEAGTDWSVEPCPNGLKALCSTFTNGAYELSCNALDFIRRFIDAQPAKNGRGIKNAQGDEDGSSPPSHRPLNPEDLQP